VGVPSQLEIPWDRPPKKAVISTDRPKGQPYLVSSAGSTFRWFEKNDEAALSRAEALSKSRKSSTTVYQEIPGEGKVRAQVGARIGAFDQTGKRFL